MEHGAWHAAMPDASGRLTMRICHGNLTVVLAEDMKKPGGMRVVTAFREEGGHMPQPRIDSDGDVLFFGPHPSDEPPKAKATMLLDPSLIGVQMPPHKLYTNCGRARGRLTSWCCPPAPT